VEKNISVDKGRLPDWPNEEQPKNKRKKVSNTLTYICGK